MKKSHKNDWHNLAVGLTGGFLIMMMGAGMIWFLAHV